jgi:hypothetical protein
MSAPVTADDIAALKAEGDLRRFIADLTACPPATRQTAPPVTGAHHGSAHRPGAWPAGTRTDRDTCDPECTCSLASTTHAQTAA